MGVVLDVQVVKAGQLLGQHQFDSDSNRTIKIGRLPSAQLKIDDPKVARIHAVLEFTGAEVSLIDMGSAIGTVVNGAKIHKVKLNPGDQVMIGDIQLVINIGGAPAAQYSGVQTVPNMPAPAMPMAGPTAMMPQGAMPQAMPAPMGPLGSMPGSMVQPRFEQDQPAAPIRRVTKERLRAAAVESKPHPALAAEEPMTRENRLLEMRVYWGEVLLGVYHYKEPKAITIGETKRTDFFISSEGLPTEEYPIIRYASGDYVMTFTNTMDGEVELGGELSPLQALRASSVVRKDSQLEGSYSLALPPEARAVLHWGGATFALRFVAPARRLPSEPFRNVDLQFLNMLLMSIFFHVSLIITLLVYPYDTESLRDDLFSQPDRFAKLVLEPTKEKKSTQDMLKKIRETVEKNQEKMKPEKEPPPDKNKVVLPPQTDKQVRPKKTEAQKQAEVKQKFTKMFAGVGGASGAAGSILGGGGGGSLSGTLSNVIGTAGAGSATAGLAGFGIRGGGPLTGGGMGTSRGIAGIGTAGRLGGGGMGYGSGVGIGGRKDRNLIGFSTPVVMGALPREVIQKVINENKQQIRYCYEVELQRKQDLEGKVGVKWIIAATGMVAKVMVTESTLKNKNVEECIMAKIRGWKFPAPAGGGIVEVNYPFVFRASG
ncbi:MAG: AgmX/PglI C-terminal domain-containing protein [Deltaproteobacteria bacterium]|nr:AgmX/PglI C-terminal domain-containing protein [Deltaproteobacteria bacterium]